MEFGIWTGADNKKMIKSESGQKLPSSFRSGIFDDWRRKQRISGTFFTLFPSLPSLETGLKKKPFFPLDRNTT